jgi:hypothetical protein
MISLNMVDTKRLIASKSSEKAFKEGGQKRQQVLATYVKWIANTQAVCCFLHL